MGGSWSPPHILAPTHGTRRGGHSTARSGMPERRRPRVTQSTKQRRSQRAVPRRSGRDRSARCTCKGRGTVGGARSGDAEENAGRVRGDLLDLGRRCERYKCKQPANAGWGEESFRGVCGLWFSGGSQPPGRGEGDRRPGHNMFWILWRGLDSAIVESTAWSNRAEHPITSC
jgi:hypothetical protein